MTRFQSLLLRRGATLALLAASGCHKPESAPPNIDALKNVLVKSATERLAAPAIADMRFVVQKPAEEREAAAQKIIDLAASAGGVAMRSSVTEELEILGQVPMDAAAKFFPEATGKPLKTLPEGESISFVIVLTDPE